MVILQLKYIFFINTFTHIRRKNFQESETFSTTYVIVPFFSRPFDENSNFKFHATVHTIIIKFYTVILHPKVLLRGIKILWLWSEKQPKTAIFGLFSIFSKTLIEGKWFFRTKKAAIFGRRSYLEKVRKMNSSRVSTMNLKFMSRSINNNQLR